MRIVFYTSTAPNFINTYNIYETLRNHPQNDYLIVKVNTTKQKLSFFNKVIHFLKVKKYAFKHGKNLLAAHNKKIEKRFLKDIDYVLTDTINSHTVNKVNDQKSIDIITEFNPDIIIQSGAGILLPSIFEIAKNGTLNIHHGLAPEIRGMQSTLWCLFHGLTDKLGVTCHYIDKNLDTGDIIKQYRYSYNIGDDYIKVQTKLIIEGALLLGSSLSLVNSEKNYNTTEVKSYYFSYFSFLKYNELIKNNFTMVTPNTTITKTKVKKALVL
jgi:methionyl-tRNA formyltransferase